MCLRPRETMPSNPCEGMTRLEVPPQGGWRLTGAATRLLLSGELLRGRVGGVRSPRLTTTALEALRRTGAPWLVGDVRPVTVVGQDRERVPELSRGRLVTWDGLQATITPAGCLALVGQGIVVRERRGERQVKATNLNSRKGGACAFRRAPEMTRWIRTNRECRCVHGHGVPLERS